MAHAVATHVPQRVDAYVFASGPASFAPPPPEDDDEQAMATTMGHDHATARATARECAREQNRISPSFISGCSVRDPWGGALPWPWP
jgi:hypothetical protein